MTTIEWAICIGVAVQILSNLGLMLGLMLGWRPTLSLYLLLTQSCWIALWVLMLRRQTEHRIERQNEQRVTRREPEYHI